MKRLTFENGEVRDADAVDDTDAPTTDEDEDDQEGDDQ